MRGDRLLRVQDEEFARKSYATLPPRIRSKQLKILVTGQPETGRTTTVRNLFASIAQDPEWSPVDTEGLTMEDFRTNPMAFTSVIEDRPDVSGRLSMSYIIQVRPRSPALHAHARCACMVSARSAPQGCERVGAPASCACSSTCIQHMRAAHACVV
jgi:hypothetical protein